MNDTGNEIIIPASAKFLRFLFSTEGGETLVYTV
jgi:hypothetical protein